MQSTKKPIDTPSLQNNTSPEEENKTMIISKEHPLHLVNDEDAKLESIFEFDNSKWEVRQHPLEGSEEVECRPELVYVADKDVVLALSKDPKSKTLQREDLYLNLKEGANVVKTSVWDNAELKDETCKKLASTQKLNLDQFLTIWKSIPSLNNESAIEMDMVEFPFETVSKIQIQTEFGESKNEFILEVQEKIKNFETPNNDFTQTIKSYLEQQSNDFNKYAIKLEQEIINFCTKFYYIGSSFKYLKLIYQVSPFQSK
jgi:hypothetical protein